MRMPMLWVEQPSKLLLSDESFHFPQGDNFLDAELAAVAGGVVEADLLAPLAGVRRGAFFRLISSSNFG